MSVRIAIHLGDNYKDILKYTKNIEIGIGAGVTSWNYNNNFQLNPAFINGQRETVNTSFSKTVPVTKDIYFTAILKTDMAGEINSAMPVFFNISSITVNNSPSTDYANLLGQRYISSSLFVKNKPNTLLFGFPEKPLKCSDLTTCHETTYGYCDLSFPFDTQPQFDIDVIQTNTYKVPEYALSATLTFSLTCESVDGMIAKWAKMSQEQGDQINANPKCQHSPLLKNIYQKVCTSDNLSAVDVQKIFQDDSGIKLKQYCTQRCLNKFGWKNKYDCIKACNTDIVQECANCLYSYKPNSDINKCFSCPRYSCQNQVCKEDPQGSFTSFSKCQENCKVLPVSQRYLYDPKTETCVKTPEGIYSAKECEQIVENVKKEKKEKKKKRKKLGLIIGLSVGGGVLLIIIVIFLLRFRK